MSSDKFIEKAKELVRDYTLKNNTNIEHDFDVYVVWQCYILGCQKSLISTSLHDDMYYEVTYNKDKNEIYFVPYREVENIHITL